MMHLTGHKKMDSWTLCDNFGKCNAVQSHEESFKQPNLILIKFECNHILLLFWAQFRNKVIPAVIEKVNYIYL